MLANPTPAPVKRMRDQRGWLMRDASIGTMGAALCAGILTPAMIGVNCVNELHAREGQKRLAETMGAI